jgi:uncharacterized protein (TIGR03000 family)
MFRGCLTSLFLLTTLAALLTPANAPAQWVHTNGQWQYRYPYNYGFTLGQYPYYYSYLFPPPETSVHYQPRYHAVYYPGLGYTLRYEKTGTSGALWNSYQGFVPASGSSGRGGTTDHTVTLDIHVPTPNAEVWIDGHKTTQTGIARRFVSPELEPGQEYRYTVRVQWEQGGKKEEQSQTVTVRAGERVGINFLAAVASR